MVAFPVLSRLTRFVGDKNTKVVHDLQSEDKSSNGCKMEEIFANRLAVGFYPDAYEQGIREGYRACRRCLKAKAA